MRRAVGITLLALVLGATAGCGKSSGPGVATAGGGGSGASPRPSASVDPEEQQRQFVQCMREHGVDMPDPEADGEGGARVRVAGSAGPRMPEAMQACQQYLPAGKLEPPSAEELEKLREFAKCMREHGVDIPDPSADGGVMIQKGSGPGKLDPDNPAFQEAEKACDDTLPGKIGRKG
jgi:hypothetical protein